MATSAATLQKVRTARSEAGLFASPAKRNSVLSLSLMVATLLLYNQVNRNPFINCDDDRYITENPYIRNGLNWTTVKWALTSTGQGGFWHPLTWISHALDIQLFRLNPAGHHLVSLLIHSLNVVLVFLLLNSATKRLWASFVVAAVFAVHPLNVESVAWAAERKNVLSAFFFLAAIGAYGWYVRRPNWKRYLAVLGLFACSLASKPMGVTFPFALLLLDFWPLARLSDENRTFDPQAKRPSVAWLVAEKIPLLALSAAACLVTVVAQRAAGATRSTGQFSLGIRLQNALVAYVTYLWKIAWPAGLTPVYPHPGNSLTAWQVAASALALLTLTALVRWTRRKYLLVGWLWFLGTIFPTIGLIQVGDQAMADRFAYIPEIGLFVMIVWGISEVLDERKASLARRAVPVAVILPALAVGTHRQIGYWRSSFDLWSHALAVTRNNFIAEDNLGGALILRGKVEEAHLHFEAAVRINPRDPMGRSNLGTYDQMNNRMREAVEQYEAVITLTSEPRLLAQTYANLGAAQKALGADEQARASFEQSLRLNPSQFNAWLGLGLLAEGHGKLSEAIDDLSRSVELQPTAEAYLELGRTMAKAERIPESRVAYEEALKISPGLVEAQQAIDSLYARQ